jgi:hypothetical protein
MSRTEKSLRDRNLRSTRDEFALRTIRTIPSAENGTNSEARSASVIR